MIKIIIILIAVFLALTFLRGIIKKYRIQSQTPKENPGDAGAPRDNKKNDDDNIVDAKFEEIK